METFGHDARDEEVAVLRPVREGDDGRVELLYTIGLGVWWCGRDMVDEVGQADVVCVGVRLGAASA